jgi:hypothetical protein
MDPTRHKKRWTPAENDILAQMHGEKAPRTVIGDLLSRTPGAVKEQIAELGIGKRSGGRPWTEEEVKNIRDWCKRKIRIKTQARWLGRPYDAVRWKIKRLGCGRRFVCRTWTPAEVSLLEQWKTANVPIKVQAKRLGRTIPQVRSKIRRQRLVTKNWGRAWTTKEMGLVREWQELGIPGREQARRLKRSYASWAGAVTRFKLQGHPHTNYDPYLRVRVLDGIRLGMNQAGIAAFLGKSHSAIGAIVRDLERRGIVKRLKRNGPYIINKECY